MKIMVVSDSHGQHKWLSKALAEAGPIDMFIHLGDVEGGESFLMDTVTCEKHIVRGNNDFFSDLPREEEFFIGEKKIFITHGHNYFVYLNTNRIKEEGEHRQADIVMFGHTHKPVLEQSEHITLLNPGSISFPRQAGKLPTYCIMTLSEAGEIEYDFRSMK